MRGEAVRSGAADLAITPLPSRPSGLSHVHLASDVLAAAVTAERVAAAFRAASARGEGVPLPV